jgi:hypothetical protein
MRVFASGRVLHGERRLLRLREMRDRPVRRLD